MEVQEAYEQLKDLRGFKARGTPANESLKRTSGLAATCRLAQIR
jgi:hypothetical protein